MCVTGRGADLPRPPHPAGTACSPGWSGPGTRSARHWVPRCESTRRSTLPSRLGFKWKCTHAGSIKFLERALLFCDQFLKQPCRNNRMWGPLWCAPVYPFLGVRETWRLLHDWHDDVDALRPRLQGTAIRVARSSSWHSALSQYRETRRRCTRVPPVPKWNWRCRADRFVKCSPEQVQ